MRIRVAGSDGDHLFNLVAGVCCACWFAGLQAVTAVWQSDGFIEVIGAHPGGAIMSPTATVMCWCAAGTLGQPGL
jgi:hypothetical protein